MSGIDVLRRLHRMAAQASAGRWLGPDQEPVEMAEDLYLIAVVSDLIDAAKRVNAGHTAPHDCYATGPITGNPLADLVACPGCALANALARIKP